MSFFLWLLGAFLTYVLVDTFTSKKNYVDWLTIVFWPIFVVILIVQEITD